MGEKVPLTKQEKAAAEARAVFEEQLAKGAEAEAEAAAAKKQAEADAISAELAARLKARRAEGKEARRAAAVDKAREQDAKEASVPGSDPRDSVFDGAPGKRLDDILQRNEDRAAGKFGDAPVEPKPAQWYVVTDERDLIEVARSLGLPDHSELGAINGRWASNYDVQRGERVILPAHYTFVDIDGVITEGEEPEGEAEQVGELAGAEATA